MLLCSTGTRARANSHEAGEPTVQGTALARAGGMAQRSIAGASFWMVLITLLLSFVPLINGLIGGMVGGYLAGGVRRGLLAALLPAVIVAVALWVILALFALPVIGLVSGLAIGIIILLADVGMLIGAALGGYIASVREPHLRLPT